MTQDAQPDDPRLFQGTLWLSLHVLALGLASRASRLLGFWNTILENLFFDLFLKGSIIQ